ncbi:hypothetical protein H4S14_000240 [Agrobacterium vitis]|nr:hypothetical protein [Agrobacterium vitis]MBE1436513.1 hypothetical protein [Agrobacterium vitis]
MKYSDPIFLFSSYRTASTWIWSKFRAAPTALAYYEIFNGVFAYIDHKLIFSLNGANWTSKHPAAAPYFLEFLPLKREPSGIEHYDACMAYESYIPQGGIRGDLLPAEVDYISSLIGNANDLGRIPVLSCTRALARTHAIKKQFGGTMIFCHRNLFDQWASYCGQAALGNPFFLETIDLTLKACGRDPFLSMVNALTSARTISPDDENLFKAFLLLHLYMSVHAFEAADIRLDMTALAADKTMQYDVGKQLSQLVGAPMDLSDAKSSFEVSSLQVRDMNQLTDEIRQFTKLIRAECCTEAGADFLEKTSDEALRSWHVHEFYTKRARSMAQEEKAAQASRIRQMEAELDLLRRQVAAADAAKRAADEMCETEKPPM